MKENTKRSIKAFFNDKRVRTIISLLTPILLFYYMIVLQNITIDVWYYIKIKVQIFTLLIFYLVFFILGLLTKSFKRSTIIMFLIVTITNLISNLRYIYSGEVLTFSDFAFATNVGQISTLMGTTIVSVILELFPIYASALVVMSLIVWINKKCNIKFTFNVKKRIVIALILMVPIVIVFMPIPGLKELMLNNIFDKNKQNDFRHNTLITHYYSEFGLFGGMYWSYLENRIEPNKTYDSSKMQEILDNVEDTSTKDYGKPNIIITFSESFYDINKISEDVKFDKDVTPNLHRLQKEGIAFETISPSYGGISANVEFELLTGFSCNYFGRGYTPFMQLFRNSDYATRHSIIRELNNNGYKTKVVFGRDYFKSEKIYKYLGINEYEELDVKSEFKGYYTSDEYLTTNVINTLEEKPDGERLFHLTCTIESHMPFIKEKYDDDEYEITIKSSNLSCSMTECLLSYAQSCYDADKELGRLYEYIQNYDEPTILIFFGDHLPYISDPDTQDDILDYLKYFNTDDVLLNTFRKYNTQGVILANFDLGEHPEWSYLSADMVLTNIINNMDIEVSDYYKWLATTSNDLPASNYLVSCDTEGNLYWTDNLKGKMKEILELRENMQYKVLIDEK